MLARLVAVVSMTIGVAGAFAHSTGTTKALFFSFVGVSVASAAIDHRDRIRNQGRAMS